MNIEIANREELARLFTGITAELGVAKGEFSETILRNGDPLVHYAIDRWSDHHNHEEYHQALIRLDDVRCRVMRLNFNEACLLFRPEMFNQIYIDGYAHTGQEGGQTLDDWWPKLIPGGLFAGHDYDPAWPKTVEAVDAFAQKHGLEVYTTKETHPKQFRSWFIRKPL